MSEEGKSAEKGAVKTRVMRYVLGYYESQQIPVPIGYISRRMSQIVSKSGLTWYDLVAEMCQDGLIREIYGQNGTIYLMPVSYWDMMSAVEKFELQQSINNRSANRKRLMKQLDEEKKKGGFF